MKTKVRVYAKAFLKHDLKASITVFFVALPLCLGISLASNAPIYSGLIAGIVGGIVIPIISKSPLSVSGPAAGLTSICAAAILHAGALDIFFISIVIAGILQILLGVFKLGGFTQFIPSAVIKGMLAAIGFILISKQIPLFIGYDQPDFWTNELFNVFTFRHGYQHTGSLMAHSSAGAIIIAISALGILILWKKYLAARLTYIPTSFIVVLYGIITAFLFNRYIPSLQLNDRQFVQIPENIFSNVQLPAFSALFSDAQIWENGVIICFIASMETLLSIAAIDKIDPLNRITPQNRELVAQGTGNIISGLLGGIPITAVIVRSSANAEAGARSKVSAVLHGFWLLLAVLFAITFLNKIPYCVLAVLLIRTGYNLLKPQMILAIYRQGREQFLPFIVTVISILFSNLLTGVLIGVIYAIFFLIKHTYRAGYTINEKTDGHIRHFIIDLALNVSFMNKKRIAEMLDALPGYAVVEINGTDSVYIDRDVLEIFQEFRAKAHAKHIQLIMHNIPEVDIIELH